VCVRRYECSGARCFLDRCHQLGLGELGGSRIGTRGQYGSSGDDLDEVGPETENLADCDSHLLDATGDPKAKFAWHNVVNIDREAGDVTAPARAGDVGAGTHDAGALQPTCIDCVPQRNVAERPKGPDVADRRETGSEGGGGIPNSSQRLLGGAASHRPGVALAIVHFAEQMGVDIDESGKQSVSGEIHSRRVLREPVMRDHRLDLVAADDHPNAGSHRPIYGVDQTIGGQDQRWVHRGKLALRSPFRVGSAAKELAHLGVFDRIADDGHEQVLFGADPVSGLRCIISIHSTALGPALGGTRFYPYESEDEALVDVLRLSRGMTYKAAAAGLDLGGGKAVIIGNPATDKSERLFRAYGRVVNGLGGRYITAEDVGTTTEDMEFIRRETRWALGTPVAEGGSGDPSPATARGLLASLKAVSRYLWGPVELAGRRLAVQGVGKVGFSFVRLLVEQRCEVVVTDAREDAIHKAVSELGVKAVAPDDIFSVDCDIFSPCALGGVLNPETIPRLACEGVVGSANNQLATGEDAQRLAGRGILYAPDFVVNAGGLINVYDELRGYSKTRAMHRVDALFEATGRILEAARAEGVEPATAAERLAERRIAEIGSLRSLEE